MPYCEITYREFKEFMLNEGFNEVNDTFSGEYVFEKVLTHASHPQFTHNWIVRIYSSVSKSTNKTRNVGTDAIRLIIIDPDTKRKMRGDKRVNRIETWKNNLQKRLENWTGIIEWCPQCGYPLVDRKGKYGAFVGCYGFPQCGYTQNKGK